MAGRSQGKADKMAFPVDFPSFRHTVECLLQSTEHAWCCILVILLFLAYLPLAPACLHVFTTGGTGLWSPVCVCVCHC